MKYFLAIDIGASSGRHIVGWLDNGKLNTEEVYRFTNGAEQRSGRLCWNADKLFDEILNGLVKAKEAGKAPTYVGIDTWAVDYALLDGSDNRIGEVYCYRDNRTAQHIDSVHRIVPFDELYSRTGIQFQPFNTVYQLYDDKVSGKLNGAKSFLMLPDYLNFLLTGVKKQEYTNATSTGLVNATTHTWDKDICDMLGLKSDLFGDLTQPGTTVGNFKQEIADKLGYTATVVLPATHDTASAVIATPLEAQTPYISSGTWSLLGVEQNEAHTDKQSQLVNYSNEGGPNFTFRYQKNIMGLWIIQSVKRELKDEYTFPQLAQCAQSQPSGELIDVNDNRFLAPKSMCDEIDNAVGKKLSIAKRMRVIYDSLALSYATAIKELEHNTQQTYDTINIIGGGSRDKFLNELTAQATGKKIIAGPIEATAIGNLAMQMIGTGEIKDISTARKIIKQSFEINIEGLPQKITRGIKCTN
ncbi:MAG: rhamnulokinase [Clostridiales bacterium]|nr:rhamnulokinase [Clostridiales bacterium]